ncbi:MAG: tyramine oxidase subunit B [Synergistes jonesii]|uniref:tyramine oxidase subunit B n=1 Tax=Synergistes jonesii TaxID=2754 RepID=UPI002A75965C|nr:tyramine oxidase subunit B [Synergistes jonesii]MDY2985977.1 tyramine oxidase subunit B [Synergistes jonesii]
MAGGKEVKTLLLSQDDLLKVGVTNMADCIDVIEGVFSLIGKGDYLMGGPLQNEHGQMIYFPDEERFPGMPVSGPDRRFMSMIGYLGGKYKICGEKWYGSNPANTSRGLPRSILTTILNDADTGAPFAIMSGNQISAMRTGAVPGVIARHLARKGSKVVGVIGGGVVNRGGLLAIKTAVPTIEEAVLYDINLEKGKKWAEEESKALNIKVSVTTKIEEAIRPADVVAIATGGNVVPRIEKEWLKKGALVIFTGDADFDPEAYSENTVFADNWKMHQAFIADGKEHPKGLEAVSVVAPSYHLLLAIQAGKFDEKKVRNLGDVVNGIDKGRSSDDEIIMFVTGGMPLHDIAWGKTLYDRAVKEGLGQEFCFFKEAYWR